VKRILCVAFVAGAMALCAGSSRADEQIAAPKASPGPAEVRQVTTTSTQTVVRESGIRGRRGQRIANRRGRAGRAVVYAPRGRYYRR
jgi:hypothetical protein